jgi:hypothetical protein
MLSFIVVLLSFLILMQVERDRTIKKREFEKLNERRRIKRRKIINMRKKCVLNKERKK